MGEYVNDTPRRREMALIDFPDAEGYALRNLCTIRGWR
jgi:hypothetical protein